MIRSFNSGRQRPHDGLASQISSHARNARVRMRRFQAECQLSVRRSIEWNAEFNQVAHTNRPIFGNQFGNRRINQSGSRHDRIGSVLVRAVLRMKRGGKPALRPRGRRCLSERSRRDDCAGARRQSQRQKQAREPGANNQDTRIACGCRGGISFGPRPVDCGQEMPPSALFHSAGMTLPALTSAPCMRDADWMVRVKLSGA